MPVLEGFLFGLGMVIFIGPVFFTLIHSSFQFGMKAGFAVALGILASDVLIVGLCSYCLIGFFENEDHRSWMALIGSGILFYLGFKYILKPAKMINDVKDPTMLMLSSFFCKRVSREFC
mgnify:CR=1 FL=1